MAKTNDVVKQIRRSNYIPQGITSVIINFQRFIFWIFCLGAFSSMVTLNLPDSVPAIAEDEQSELVAILFTPTIISSIGNINFLADFFNGFTLA